jgi:iron complex transport system substrate-binding protein
VTPLHPTPARLISLLPSATEIVHAIGLGELQIGRSHECDYPPSVRVLPVCSRPSFPVSGSSAEINAAVKSRLAAAVSLYEVDLETVAALAPTLIITQSQCEVCAVSLDDVERALQTDTQTNARLISLQPNSLADIWDDIARIAASCGREEAGGLLITSLKERMRGITAQASMAPNRPSVACVEWLDPLMAAGNWVPELVEAAGGRNLLGEPGRHSPWMSWEDLAHSDPDVIIALPCGFDLKRTRSEMHCLTGRAGWGDLKAVRNGNVFLCDGNQFMNRPGPRVAESLQILAEILHPDLFEPALQHTGWERH